MTTVLYSKKVLVTGGAGFIGSELVRQLLLTGAQVLVVDNLVNGKHENLLEIQDQIQLETIDIRDLEPLRKLLRGVDIVYHLACLGVRHSIHSPLENHAVNATGTLQLLECARDCEITRFVYVSSSEVYGTARSVPMTELHPTLPHTVYGGSKLAGECYTRAFYATYQFPTTVIRPFNAFGPRSHHEGDCGEVIPKFMLRGMAEKPMIIFGDGEQTRDFSFVTDTARGILQAGLSDSVVGETINLGSGKEITVNNLATAIAKLLGKPLNTQYDQPRCADVLRLCGDISKAQQLLNFAPRITLEQGLRELYQWYQTQQSSAAALLEQERVYNWQVS